MFHYHNIQINVDQTENAFLHRLKENMGGESYRVFQDVNSHFGGHFDKSISHFYNII